MKTCSFKQVVILIGLGSCLWIPVSGFGFTNLVINGGFEVPLAPVDGWATFSASNFFDGWTVEYGAVNVHSTNWYAPAFGHQSLDLNDSDSGAVFQDIQTVGGQTYKLRFAFGANTVSVGYPSTGPAVKEMEVLWDTNILGILKHDVTGRSPSDVGWSEYSFLVVGTGLDRLTFRSLTPGSAGPAIDQVSVTFSGEPLPLASGVSIQLLQDSAFVCWPAVLGQSYQVQWSDRLHTNVWTYLGPTVVGDGNTACISDPVGTNLVRMYRVLEQ